MHVPISKFPLHSWSLSDCGSEATDITKMCLFKRMLTYPQAVWCLHYSPRGVAQNKLPHAAPCVILCPRTSGGLLLHREIGLAVQFFAGRQFCKKIDELHVTISVALSISHVEWKVIEFSGSIYKIRVSETLWTWKFRETEAGY